MNIAIGIMIPLIGTTLGAGCVLFLKNDINCIIYRYSGSEISVMMTLDVALVEINVLHSANVISGSGYYNAIRLFHLNIEKKFQMVFVLL